MGNAPEKHGHISEESDRNVLTGLATVESVTARLFTRFAINNTKLIILALKRLHGIRP